MGYLIEQTGQDFGVQYDNIPGMIKAIKDLAQKTELMRGGRYENGKKVEGWFSWVDMTYVKSDDIEEIFKAWGFETDFDDQGNIVGLNFFFEKSGQEDLLLGAVAPYVKDGSYIEFMGEDGFRWKWVFENGIMVEKKGRFVWEECLIQ